MHTSDDAADRLIYQAEIRAEWAIAALRLTVAVMLLLLIVISSTIVPIRLADPGGRPHVTSFIAISGFTFTSVSALLLIRFNLYWPPLGWLFALLDLSVVVASLVEGVHRSELPGNYLFLVTSAWAGPLILAFNALRYRASIVATASILYVTGGLAVAFWAGTAVYAPPPLPEVGRLADMEPNLVRLGFITLVGFCLALVVFRGRRLLVRALKEQRERMMLTRFLPAQIVAELTRPESRLRQGTTCDCSVLFVDLRDSTGITERMSPDGIGDFLTRFRTRITRAVEQYGGLIEKFAGDGALVVFGVPDPRPDDGQRALACAKRLVRSIDEWNHDGDAPSPLSVVVGVHAGRCFSGVVGDESRLEFTVVGDAVNVAARLEALAKQHDESLIASHEALERAGEEMAVEWHALGAKRLRGRDALVGVFAYRGRAELGHT
ncbi:adenylate/guanylate cyclase domain-containing protein (plasmid) [Microvirga terrae]|uniref:Adenylate/guanylate cyclase domain-containing protein n=1 Tax=Microvirga terrae TaxID=2740529 RepID=A0ABY5S206_9HYPH|nr:adenylate/guanylate cyclase domain-containing protein [Microvirga terrae]UVF22566.1 adenylate/guanylate cyclase domain-containing protein [Microvirga terrae]